MDFSSKVWSTYPSEADEFPRQKWVLFSATPLRQVRQGMVNIACCARFCSKKKLVHSGWPWSLNVSVNVYEPPLAGLLPLEATLFETTRALWRHHHNFELVRLNFSRDQALSGIFMAANFPSIYHTRSWFFCATLQRERGDVALSQRFWHIQVATRVSLPVINDASLIIRQRAEQLLTVTHLHILYVCVRAAHQCVCAITVIYRQ